MSHLPSLPDGNLIDIFRAYPELASPLHDFAENLMRGECPLSAADRELIAVYVSELNDCAFCRDSHSAALAGLAGSAVSVDSLVDDPALESVRPAMRPVLRFVQRLNNRPGDVRRADIEAMLDAGWDERAVVYATLVCGFFNLMNRWVEGLGFESEAGVVEQAGRMLAARGYGAINDMLR